MAVFDINLRSKYTKTPMDISVITPEPPHRVSPESYYGSGKKYKVLWILHGGSEDRNAWMYDSAITELKRQVIMVIPTGLDSDFVNHPEFGDGYNFTDFFFEELMPFIHGWFPASSDPKDNFLTGSSMGGAGTVTFGLLHPELFGGLAPLSFSLCKYDYLNGLRDLTGDQFKRLALADRKRFPTEYGKPGDGITLKEINKVAKFDTVGAFIDSYEHTWNRFGEKFDKLPPMYATCGTDDPCYPKMLQFKEYAQELGAENITFDFVPGYKHNMEFWSLAIVKAMDFFGIE